VPSSSIHTVYWSAHRFDVDSVASLGQQARSMFDRHAPTPAALAAVLDWADDPLTATVHARVQHRLAETPVEDVRIDFEDGYGLRPDAEEDADATRVGQAIAEAARTDRLPSTIGLRIKPLTHEFAERSIATLDRCVTALVQAHGGLVPGFVVTLPKVTFVEQLQTMDALLLRLERKLGLAPHAIDLEFMIEVPHAVFDPAGRVSLPGYLAAVRERLVGVHVGVYDFTAAVEVAAGEQAMDHPACDLVRGLMRLAYSGTGLVLSAGSTNSLPVAASGESESAAVTRGWRASATQIRHVLRRGYYHGWDLHPGQIPVRYAACHRFFLEGLPAAAGRLRTYLQSATFAMDHAAVLDDVATGQALLGFFVRGRACGAFTDGDLLRGGLHPSDLATGRFVDLLARGWNRP
jgi:citrate lyase beta subunit